MNKEAIECPKCNGKGNNFIYMCWDCRGTGYLKKPKTAKAQSKVEQEKDKCLNIAKSQ